MSGHVLVPLLESVVLLNVMEVISSEYNGTCHLVRENNSLEESATDRNRGSERTLVVDVFSFNSLLGSFEAKTDSLVVTRFGGFLRGQSLLGVLEDAELFLVSSFGLNISHD